jgi:predicted Rossmann fold flavoprotein
MLARYKKSGQFLFSAFTQYGVTETISFFNERGMEIKEEADGRMFPVSNKAQSVWNVLNSYLENNNVRVRTMTGVLGITHDEAKEQMVITLIDKSIVRAKTCIVATGGTSRPQTGSTGEGFGWLKKLGHTIIENDVALVPIALTDAWVKKVAGVVVNDIKLTTLVDGTKRESYKGKILFTHVGISGPTVLNMSKEVGELLQEGLVTISLDLFPTLDEGTLRIKLQTLLTEQSNKKIKNVLSSLIPPALVIPVLGLVKIDSETPNHSIRTEERKALIKLLKAIPLHVEGLLGKDKAVVSSGGVTLSEVDFKTMQSRINKHLFLVGDVLNIDRPSGGYSLQLCWTTGYIAGNSC